MEKVYKILANVDQDLTDGEKHQARTNIGAIGGVKVSDSSGTTELVPDEDGKVTVDLTNVGNVPSFSGSDNGLVLGVVGSSDPELQWVSKGGGGTSYTAGDGIDIDANDVISAKVDGTSIGVNASGEIESLATVDQHYDASSTNAQSGTAVAEAVSGVSGVPSVGSSDDGKVLTANYTGGSGTFSWQDPPAQEQADWTEQDTSDPSYIKNKPTLATVAFTGAYSDLSGTPTIPAAQEQADWAQTNTSAVDFIKNKPSIPSKTSDLTNDSGFITASDEAVKGVTQNGTSVVNAQGVAEIVTRDVPSSTSSDSGKVLTVDSSGSPVWVTPSGGQSYTAGNGIDITSDVISAKLDGSTLTNGSNGLSVTNPVPDTTGASQGDVLSVGSSGLEWVAPGGGGGSNIFVAEYGVTSIADVRAAIKAGKQVFAKREHLSAQGHVASMEWGTLCTAYDGPSVGTGRPFDPDDVRTFKFFVSVNQYDTYQPHSLHWSDTVVMWSLDNSGSTGSWSLAEYPAIKPINAGDGFVITYGGYSNTYSVKVDGTTVGFDSNGNLTVLGGGTTYSAGSGIIIANDTIAAKVDGTTVSFNASGELQATASSLQTKPLVAGTGVTLTASASDVTISAYSQLPSYSSANSGESLVVNGNGDGVEWSRRISGVMYDGASSTELRRIRLNTYNNPNTPGLVAAFPSSGQGASCGFLMPDPGFVADETVDKVARVIENPNNSGVCMLEYQDDAAVISPLEKVSITTSTNPYEINAQPGKWYEIICSQSTAQTWHIYLEANSTVTTNTVHTIVRITRTDSSVSCSPSLVWHDERGIIHYEPCDLTGTTSYYDFDCLVRKNGYSVGGTPWSFARVRRI